MLSANNPSLSRNVKKERALKDIALYAVKLLYELAMETLFLVGGVALIITLIQVKKLYSLV